MARVCFSDAREFIEEITRDRDGIDRGILRLTMRYKVEQTPYHSVAVQASALVRGHVVTLRTSPLYYLSGLDEERKAIAAAKDQADAIHSAAVSLGLEVRPGAYEVV